MYRSIKIIFFACTNTEWNSLDLSAWKLSYQAFKKHLIHEFKLLSSPLFNIYNPAGIKLVTNQGLA